MAPPTRGPPWRMPCQIPTYLGEISTEHKRRCILAHSLSSLGLFWIPNGNSCFARPQQRGADTTETSPQEQEPFISETIVAVQTSGIRGIKCGSEHQCPLWADVVRHSSGECAAYRHQAIRQGICCIIQLRLKTTSVSCLCIHRASERTLAFPPAPRLFKAVQIPGSQKETRPTMMI